MNNYYIPENLSKDKLIELLISSLNTRKSNALLKGCGMEYINIIIEKIIETDDKYKIWWDK